MSEFVNVDKRHICVLYTTATCNLKCRYCYIDKSPILVKIDKMLEQSYQGDYYFNFMQEIFPDPYQLEQMEFWGGEPSYGLPRIEETIKKALIHYPALNRFMMSTNLTTDRGLECLLNFFKIFKLVPDRKIIFCLQLSLDGPTEINDLNRGQGVTKLFIEHYSKMLFQINDILDEVPNLTIQAHFKPTLDASSIAQLQTKEAVIKYYQFFEPFKEALEKYNIHDRFILDIPVPNTATPAPHTVQDGKNFAKFIDICKDIIINDNEGTPYFKYPRNILPYQHDLCCPDTNLTNGCLTCGSGSIVVGLLPNKMLSSCHSGFVDLLEEYRKKAEEQSDMVDRTIDAALFFEDNVKNQAIHTMDEYAEYERQMNAYCENSKFQIEEEASLIQLYAQAGQIDEKYKDIKEAIKAAHFIQHHTCQCCRDNVGVTGSKFLFQVGYIKLFLNGAKELMEDVERYYSILARTR